MTSVVDYGAEEQAMQAYFREGRARAMALGNRGPLRFTAGGKLLPEIMQAYERYGFYVFEGVIPPSELAELEADYLDMLERLPHPPEAKVDRYGRPALGSDLDVETVFWVKPLSDPFGGTDQARGRYHIRMFEPKPGEDAPEKVVFSIVAPLQYSDAYLRLYGKPEVLRLAAAVNGDDFVPFMEGFVIKWPGEGASFAWHQDGTTHWDSPDWNQHIHGVNFMPQLYGSNPANGVWFVPGTHAVGRVDIAALSVKAGSDRLKNAVPLVCGPGDMAISNRQVVHGSFANTSPDCRVTLSMGFHPRGSVVGATGYVLETNQPNTYDAAWVDKRCEMIGYAIDARRQHFPDETPYLYRPHAEAGKVFHWDDAARIAIRGYNRFDLRI